MILPVQKYKSFADHVYRIFCITHLKN